MKFPASLVSALAPAIFLVTHSLFAMADPLQPLTYSTTLNTVEQTATFNVTFDREPDFWTVNEYGRAADSFQFWVDSVAPDPVGRTYDALFGELPAETQTVIASREIPIKNLLQIIWVLPLSEPGPKDAGGWGSVEGEIPFQVTENALSFEVPLSLLRDDDGVFYYAFDIYHFGAAGLYPIPSGISGRSYVAGIPEPGTNVMLMLGVGLLGFLLVKRNPDLRSYSLSVLSRKAMP